MSDLAAQLARRWEHEGSGAKSTPVVAAAIAVTLAGLTAFAVAGNVLSAAGALAAGILWLVACAWWVTSRGRAALRAQDEVAGGSTPGRHNLEAMTAALALEVGVAPPRVTVVAGDRPNALAIAGKRAVVAVTEGALLHLGRTELEALLVHCLVRTDLGRGSMVHLVAALGPLAPRVRLVGAEDDIATVAVTRYPPALRRVLEKSRDATGPSGPYWFSAASSAHVPRKERIAALADL